MDGATCLVVPSRSEGLGRVILEAFARGRAVVATRVGGIPDLVEHDLNGLLVEGGNVTALVDALTQILTEDGLAARLGAAAYEASQSFEWSPDDYAARVRSLVDQNALRKRARDAPDLRHAVASTSEDPILGATVAKLRALAQRCDELVVITDRVGAHDLPANCTLRTFGSRTKLGRGLRYMRALVPQLLRRAAA